MFQLVTMVCLVDLGQKQNASSNIQGIPKKGNNRMCWSHCAPVQSPLAGTPWAWKMRTARFLLRLRRIKRLQDISMGKFGPIALNFGYDFFY